MPQTGLVFCALVCILAAPAQSQPAPTQPLPMLQAEACTIALTPASAIADVGGRVAVYRVGVDKDGSVATLELLERTDVARFVVLEGLEDCIRGWRFGNVGVHTLAVFGGTRAVPAIHVTQGQQSFRLRLHYDDRRP
jgi:hypothetical protein